MEDVALYSESVLYHLLTLVFPTMRLWGGATTSQAIEWLYKLNRFLGLQGESLYYRPLVQRVREIKQFNDNSDEYDSQPKNLLLTGHSLGIYFTFF